MSRLSNRIFRSEKFAKCRLSSLHLHRPFHRNQKASHLLLRSLMTDDKNRFSVFGESCLLPNLRLYQISCIDDNYRLDDEIMQKKYLNAY